MYVYIHTYICMCYICIIYIYIYTYTHSLCLTSIQAAAPARKETAECARSQPCVVVQQRV